jgi:preprotein translocase subunit Sec61beta
MAYKIDPESCVACGSCIGEALLKLSLKAMFIQLTPNYCLIVGHALTFVLAKQFIRNKQI